MKQLILLFISAAILSCKGQTTNNTLFLADFKFNSIFGMNKNDSTNVYCLLGNGFFRTPSSDNADSLIADWIIKHTKAIVIPVSSDGPLMTDNKESKIIYCWVIDGNDTINNYLIRNGSFPGWTMHRPQTWSEMSSYERSIYNDTDKSNVEVLISKKKYNNFIEQIKTAEKFAAENKLGIWLNPEKYH